MALFDVATMLMFLVFWVGVFWFHSTLRRLERALDRMEASDKVVAHNLADSVSRADATDGPEGAAADAALRTGDSAEAIHERQDAAQ